MSKAKISPWPWKIYPTHNKIEIQDANAQQVAVVWSGEMRHGGHSKSRYMNARLLALAPKLLEECGNALRVLRRINNPDVGCTCHTDGHYCAACTTRDLETIVACASEVPDVFTVDPWCHKETHAERAIDPAQGHTLTPAAKPEAKPADAPVVSGLWGRIHTGSGKIRVYASKAFAEKAQAGCRHADWVVMDQPLANHQPQDLPTANGGKAGLDNVPTVKENLTTEPLHQTWKTGIENDIRRLESRLAAPEKPADKDAARVVKAPTFAPSRVFSPIEKYVIDELNNKWRAALIAAGMKVEAAE